VTHSSCRATRLTLWQQLQGAVSHAVIVSIPTDATPGVSLYSVDIKGAASKRQHVVSALLTYDAEFTQHYFV
jgi:hypothetical protein